MSEINKIIENILREIVGEPEKSNIIKINHENLSIDGDFWFPSNILAWRGLIKTDDDNKSSKNILDYYLSNRGIATINLSTEEITKLGIDSLIEASKNWSLRIDKGCQQRERICLSLNRCFVIKKIIKEALKNGKTFGQLSSSQKTIFLETNNDEESNLTTLRLEKLRKFAGRILKSQGYEISQNSDDKFILTTKSQGKIDEKYKKWVCGVVKNPMTNVKETTETYDSYLQKKISELEGLNEGRGIDCETRLRQIAEAIITFELLGVRPSRPCFIDIVGDSDRSTASTKGGSFVLYNSARIEAILGKFKEECLAGRYPEILGIDEVDFDRLSLEEEWNLIFNFILAYPHVLMNSVQYEDNLELCPQYLCTFLSHLSQKFSVYYRRTRILTEGREHLIPTMMARLYLLKALQIVVNNALEILDITAISRM